MKWTIVDVRKNGGPVRKCIERLSDQLHTMEYPAYWDLLQYQDSIQR